MIVAWLLAVVLFGLCGVLHARAMAFAMNFTDRNDIIGMHGLVVALYVLATAHVAEAGLYAIGFILGEWIGIGGFEQENVNSVMDFFYFSVVNYTSLGLGDIYPTGHLRFLAGIEALNGFLLISCSASTIFLVTTRRNH
ncbi:MULTISPECIES: ion channel [Rhodobacterales]|uniref:Two pore domain potassium channel family protein n=1 Tax=Pelagivirga sediminicola TaxID=2170575 RepID=A0A2T7G3P8_9RHOB|nr:MULTISPECIES: ion channel [Rhodobacterales]MCQ0090371.1 two pore domain potassium channel family protein [Roseovarius sp. M141]PVA09030.1 two pore domain potassium channel family protein [Pelagivirga sediminicola]